MKNKRFMRIVCMILSVILTLGLLTGALVTVVSAATTYQLISLLDEGKIKPLGRTQANKAGTGITANWSANGFEINVNANGGDFAVGYKSTQGSSYLSILVDGVQAWRGLAIGTGTVKAPITKGKHTVTVMRENGHDSSGYLHLTTVSFDGTIETAPAKKNLYIEVIGDSYACGAGSAADYEAGVRWGDMDHSAQASFGWYLSKMLNADLSIVARGGIGLFDGTSEQEGTANTVTMYDIYPNASGHNTDEGAYSFARKPDLVVIELGANDGIDSTDPAKTMSNWVAKLRRMIDLVREKNGANTKILLLNHTASKYYQMLKIADEQELTWACYFSHHGNGSAALEYQVNGHPSADDEYEIAQALHKTIEDNDILGKPAVTEPAYNDIVYYVSQNGNNNNTGKSIDAAKQTLNAALTAAKAGTYAKGDRVVVYVEGTVVGSSTQQYGGISAIKDTSGNRVPVLVTTYNYNGSNAAELKHTFTPTAGGACATYAENDFYFKDLTIKSYTYTHTDGAKYCVNSFYAAGSDVTFDNVTMVTDKQSNYSTWIVSADNFSTGGGILNAQTKDIYSTVTFKNGDYTGIYRVAAMRADSIWRSEANGGSIFALPKLHCKIIVEDGAILKDVFAAYGKLGVAEAVVELRGGTVKNYTPTRSGTTADRFPITADVKTVFAGGAIGNTRFMGTGSNVNITGNVTTEFKKGQFVGTLFTGAGENVTITGNITNNISGGEIRLNPTSTSTGNDGIYLGGFKNVNLTGTLTNNISGGNLNLIYNAAVDCGIYLGMRGGSITGDLTNNISAGNFYVQNGEAKATSSGIYLGMYGGHISGTQTNNISGGIFSGTANFGFRTIGNKLSKMVNVIGTKDSLQGPRFLSEATLGGGWAYLGTYLGNVMPTAENSSDTVVQHNTIYSGYFAGSTYGGVSGKSHTDANGVTTYSYTCGSVQTDIYGGRFNGYFYATKGTTIAGHVTTNIYGGIFRQIHGNYTATVLDGVEMNIYGMKEFYPLQEEGKVYGIWASGAGGTISAKTAGRPAVALNIAPENNEDLVLRTPVYAGFSGTSGTVNGDTVVSVSGGFYPLGFKVDGKTVGEVLAPGAALYHYENGAKATYADTDASVSGYLQVVSDGEAATRATAYYVRPNGLNASDGKTFATAKKTLKAVFDQAVADNGGSAVFPNGTKLYIYVDGTVGSGSGQNFLYGKKLTTADGKPLETVITTYKYSGTKATIVYDYATATPGTNQSFVATDLNLKNVDIMSKAPSGSNLQTLIVYARGNTVTFDNANLLTDNEKKWVVAADSSAGKEGDDAKEMHGTLIFKNGDYTNLSYVTTVNADNCWYASGKTYAQMPKMHTKVLILDGAKMGGVYGPVGKMAVGTSTVEVQGGQVANLYGTGSGTKTLVGDTDILVSGGTVTTLSGTGNTKGSAIKLTGSVNITVSGGSVGTLYGVGDPTYVNTTTEQKNASVTVTGDVNITVSGGTVGNFYGTAASESATGKKDTSTTVTAQVTINGNMNNTFSGGTIGGSTFYTLGNRGILNGNMNNTFSGTDIVVTPNSGSSHGIFFAGNDNINITKTVTNTVTAGNFSVVYDTEEMDSGIYFGNRNGGTIGGDLINNVSGGTFQTQKGKATVISHAAIHFGPFVGTVKGDLKCTVTGGSFEVCKSNIYFGGRGIQTPARTVTVVIGEKDTDKAPVFKGVSGSVLFLTGGWGRYGDLNGDKKSQPADGTVVQDTVVDITVYGGDFQLPAVAGGNAMYSVSNGTITNPTYILGSVKTQIHGGSFTNFYASGKIPVYGNVTTDIYGGTFNSIYGGKDGKTMGEMSLTIHGMTEGSSPTGIWAGGTTGAFKDVSLTIDPKTKLTLSMPISAGCSSSGTISGTTTVLVKGGTYTNGFAVNGLKVKDVLAPGLVPVKDSDQTVIAVTDTMTTTGTDSVTLTAADLSSGSLLLSDVSVTWDGKTDAMVPTAIVRFKNTTLTEGTDYTLSYSRDGSATTDTNSLGTITMIATGKGTYSGTASATYTVVRDDAVGAAIAAVTARVNDYHIDSVTQNDNPSLSTLVRDIQNLLTDYDKVLTTAEKSDLNGLIVQAQALLDRIAKVSNDLAAAENQANYLTEDTVTADDRARLDTIDQNLRALPDGNLTASQKQDKQETQARVAMLKAVIDEVESDLAAAKEVLATISEATVTADDSAKLTKLAADLNAIPDSNLTAAQQAEKKAAAEQVAKLQKTVEDVNAALGAAKTQAFDYYTNGATAEDSTALAALMADIQAIPDGNLTSAQRTERDAAYTQVLSVQNAISNVQKTLEEAEALLSEVTDANVTSADVSRLDQMVAQLNALPEANMTVAQRIMAADHIAQIANRKETVDRVVKQLQEAEAEVARYAAMDLTADHLTELDELASHIFNMNTGNMTEAQKATRTLLLDRVKAMMDAVRNAGETLEQLKAEIGAYNISTIKKTDLEALDRLVDRLDAIPDSALNATQRAEKQSLGSKLTELTARIAQVMSVISHAETELAKYTMDNVSADDKEAIQDVAASLNELSEANMTEEQKQAVAGHNTRINALLAKIGAISDEMLRIFGEIGTYETANVTSADLGDLEKLEDALEAVSNDNLSAVQLRQKQDAMARIAELKAVIADVAAKLAEGRKAFEGITEANVTADHQAKILAARETLRLIEDDKLTQAEREERQTLLDKAYDLLATIEDTEQALTAVEDQLRLVSATHATADDLPTLSGIKTRLEAISDGNLTAAQKARKEAALAKVAEAQAAVQKAAADLEALRTAVAKYSTETVTGDDMTALNKLMQDADAIVATNLTDSQRQEVNDLKQTIQNLRDIVADVAAELAAAEDAVDAYDPATVTFDDRNDLLALADQIADIADGNLYAGQKATKKALADRVQAMLKTVEDATAKLTSIKTEAGTYGLSTVTADDLPAIEKMASDLAALKDSNLTAAQKSEKATVSEKLKALKQAVDDAADTLESAASLLHRYDVESVTADEEAVLELVEGRLLQVADGNLTAAQKAEKAQLSQQLVAMRQAITDAENGLAAVKEVADTYNVDTVNSTDTEALDTLEKQIAAVPDGNLTDAQKNEKKALQTKVDQLQKRLADTAEAMKELQEAVEAYDPENLTPADKEALQALAQRLKEQPTKNLSAGEKATLQDLVKAVEDNLAIVEKAEEIAGNIDAIEEAVKGITEQNVTADDFADLQAAQKAIDELEQDPDLKQADKDRLAALEDQIAKAQAQLKKADEANDLSHDLLDITAGNVDEDDRATLEAAVKKLQDALAAYGNNYTAAEKQEMDAAIADFQAVLKVLDQAKAVEQQLLALPATASPDDEAAEKALAEAAAALEALSDHQQTLISQAALDRMAGLEKAMGDYKVLSGHGDAVSKESGKTLTFVFNGNFKKFTGIQVDGTSVDAKFYTAKSGSTIITLNSDYLDSLAEGKHTLTVLWNDGSATAEFTVKPKEVTPPTGDDMNVGLMAVLAVISVMAAASVALIGKKRRS